VSESGHGRPDSDVLSDAGPNPAPPDAARGFRLLLSHPLSTYYILLGSTMLLLTLGLIMVLSASTIRSVEIFGSPYTIALRQLMFAVLGVAVMFVVVRTSTHFWKSFAWPLLGIAGVLLVAVLIIGVEVAGQRNWIEIFGPFRLQPSEFAKYALVVWGAFMLSRERRGPHTWQSLLMLAEGDVGNVLMLGAILAGMLFAAGAPLRLFALMGGISLLSIWILTLLAPYRMDRITSWLNPDEDRLGVSWQVTQGQYALGTGGFWGVGLGASREKWGSLPEAHTDFIFSVIGEELGMVGTFSILVLLGAMAFAIFRLSRTTSDPFVRLASAGVGSWIVVQAMINIGGVLGVLPITGVPLPLVSYGGSSLVPTLVALGMVMAFARQEPGARRALRRHSTARSLRKR